MTNAEAFSARVGQQLRPSPPTSPAEQIGWAMRMRDEARAIGPIQYAREGNTVCFTWGDGSQAVLNMRMS